MKRREFITLIGDGSRMAARGARAAAGDAGDRVPQQHVIRSLCALCGRITRGEARGRKGKFSNTPRFANATTLFFDPIRPPRLSPSCAGSAWETGRSALG
jgi:hypothetical protein